MLWKMHAQTCVILIKTTWNRKKKTSLEIIYYSFSLAHALSDIIAWCHLPLSSIRRRFWCFGFTFRRNCSIVVHLLSKTKYCNTLPQQKSPKCYHHIRDWRWLNKVFVRRLNMRFDPETIERNKCLLSINLSQMTGLMFACCLSCSVERVDLFPLQVLPVSFVFCNKSWVSSV